MPLYEYQCQQCHRRVEKIQKFSDAPLTTCPHCGGTLERTLTAPAIQFKGSGWYKDLYSSAKPPAASTSDGAPAGEKTAGATDKPTSSGAESKPAATAPSSPAPASTGTANNS